MKDMLKKLLILLTCLALLSAFPAVSFAQDAPETALEESVCAPYDPIGLLAGDLLVELPDWLMALILGGGDALLGESAAGAPAPQNPYTGAPEPQTPTEKPTEGTPMPVPAYPGYVPGLYEPYTVTKTKTYYDKNGAAAYALTVSAVFMMTRVDFTCLKAQTDYRIYSGSWRITPGRPVVDRGEVTVAFQVEQLFTGVPVRKETVTLRLDALDGTETDFVSGDLNRDGRLTTADARAALRVAVKLDPQTDLALRIGDVTGDGLITTADARIILRRAVGLQ